MPTLQLERTIISNEESNERKFSRNDWEDISLYAFVREFWPVIEPGKPFVDGKHIEAICLHLEAVTDGRITRLLVNMPPRHAKSSIISVLWRVWTWIKKPATRFLCASYALSLAIRDNVKCRRIILSNKFQRYYGHIFQLTKDQNAKIKFENTKQGYSQAVSVGSSSTGEGGDILLCLCYNAEVTTDIGRLKIGDIVEDCLPVRVLAFDHSSGLARWQRIEKYEKNLGRPCVRVTLNDGRVIDATADHPFYVVGRGYIPAAQLTNTDKVITDDCYLPNLPERILPQAIRGGLLQTALLQQCVSPNKSACNLRNMWQRVLIYSEQNNSKRTHLLQQKLSLCTLKQDNDARRSESNHRTHLRGVRKDFQTISKPCRQSNKGFMLQSCVSCYLANGTKQPCISRRQNIAHLRFLRKSILSASCRISSWETNLLLPLLQKQSESSLRTTQLIRQLCILWQGNQTQDSQADGQEEFLYSRVCQSGSQRVHQWEEQSSLCRWHGNKSLPDRVHSIGPTNKGAGWTQVPNMQYDTRAEWQGPRCSPHRLRHISQRVKQSCFSLPMVSWKDAWNGRGTDASTDVLVRSVEPIETPEYVYNIRVAEDHNYFASGVLVHNCDDPHSIDEKRSDVTRDAALDWFRDTWCTRLNDQRTGAMVVVGQRVHYQDLSGYILSGETGEHWVHLNLATEFEPDSRCVTHLEPTAKTVPVTSFTDTRKQYDVTFENGKAIKCTCEAFTYHPQEPCKHMRSAKPPVTKPFWQDWRKLEGELLWPERFPENVVERAKRRHGPQGFAALYQQRPTAATGNLFDEGNERLFKIDREAGLYLLETPRGIKPVFIKDCWHFTTSDVAAKEKEQNDWTVFETWGVTPMLDLLLIDVKRGHWPIPEQKEQGYKVFLEFNSDTYQCVYFEDVGYQSAIGQELIALGVPCLPFQPEGDKVLRAGPASIWQRLGKMYFLAFARWLEEYRKELYGFPKQAHDDQVDPTSMAALIVRKPMPLSENRRDEDDAPPAAEDTGGLIPLTEPLDPAKRENHESLPVVQPNQVDPFSYAAQIWEGW